MKSPSVSIILGLSALFITAPSIAQSIDTLPTIARPVWIEKMDNKIAIDVSLNNAFEQFEVKTQTNKIQLVPNIEANLRLKLNYKFISVGIQYAPEFIPGNGENETKGNTKSFGLGVSTMLTHWMFAGSYSKIKGYYIKNTSDFIPWKEGDPYIQIPDFVYKGINLDLGYSFNPNFSIRSLSTHTERQLKSAGSLIPVFNFRYYSTDTDSTQSGQATSNFESSIGSGYIYTFVIKERFYASLGLQAGLGYLYSDITIKQPTSNLETKQDNFLLRWDAKAGIGYNGNRFYTGFYGSFSQTEYQQEGTTVRNFEDRYFYHVFIGVRFNPPKYVKKPMNWMEQKASQLNPF